MNNDQSTEFAIKAAGAAVAPRVTPADLEANITSEHYFTAANGIYGSRADEMLQKCGENATLRGIGIPHGASLYLLTFCVLVLRNGFTVTGESARASHENFNADIGRRIAKENAMNKIWPLMGYEIKSRLMNTPPTA